MHYLNKIVLPLLVAHLLPCSSGMRVPQDSAPPAIADTGLSVAPSTAGTVQRSRRDGARDTDETIPSLYNGSKPDGAGGSGPNVPSATGKNLAVNGIPSASIDISSSGPKYPIGTGNPSSIRLSGSGPTYPSSTNNPTSSLESGTSPQALKRDSEENLVDPQFDHANNTDISQLIRRVDKASVSLKSHKSDLT